MAGLSARARLYQKINDNLGEDDVRSLRAMLVTDKHLGQAKVENATPQEMFNMLEDDGKIGQGNLALLVDLLKALGKTRLAQEAEEVAKSEGMSADVSDAIACLKDLYAAEYAHVRPLPWCEDLNLDLREIYTDLQLQRRDDRGRFKDTGSIVSLADIYKQREASAQGVNPRLAVRKIRVEGPPGIGKSCSCQKLAYDWSAGKLELFKAVFFLELRHLSGKVKDAIFEQLLPRDTDISQDKLWAYIKENQDDVLFILDGLDELSQTARESTDLVDLIQGKILRNCHVLVTSRPYHCVKDLDKCHEFYRMAGYSKENSLQCIRKYFSETPESATKLVELLKSNRNLQEVVVNPLNNVLICVVWEDNGEKLPDNKAELYHMIVYSVAKRYCGKEDLLLEGDKLPPSIEEALQGLGKLSWEGLQQDQLQFNIDDIRQEFGVSAGDMLNTGLLTRDYSFSRIKRTCYCAFLHKTFQEYLAAYYISQLVRDESSREEGVKCLFTLFGTAKAIGVNSPITESYEKYREVQNILPAMLGVNVGPLFAMFAEELVKPGLEGRDLLSFICLTSLGRACENCEMAETVAPCLSPHITNTSGRSGLSKDDHAKWFDGFLQVLCSQKKLAMSHNPNLIENLTIDCYVLHDVLQQQQLAKLEGGLSECATIRSVTLCGRSYIDPDEIKEFRTSDGLEIPLVRTFIPRSGVQSVSITFPINNNTLEDLSNVPRLEHVEINIGRASHDTGVPTYDEVLAQMVRKQSCLRSLKVRISGWGRTSIKTRQFGNLTATLQSISEHTTLEEMELKHLVKDDSPRFGVSLDEPETVDVDTVVQKLTECIDKSKALKTLQIAWEFFFVKRMFYRANCSSRSLSDLSSAIQRNRTLEKLSIVNMFSESVGHQKIIKELMRNKPENFKELTVTMFKSNVVWRHCFTP